MDSLLGPPQASRPPLRRRLMPYVITALVGSLLGGVVMFTLIPHVSDSRPVWSSSPDFGVPVRRDGARPTPDLVTTRSTVMRSPEEVSQSRRTAIVRAVEQVSPAVVSIIATQLIRQRGYATLFDDPMFGRFLAIPREYLQEVPNSGSGFVISREGYVLTNAHVIQNAQRIRVVLTDGRTLESQRVGVNETSDLAVLKIDGEDLAYAPLGRSSDVMVGEWAIAIGNPFGLALDDAKPAVTVGVVSAVGRDFGRDGHESRAVYRDMIQTDASINPGNSGGPLINAAGEVIGINTFIISESGGSEGIGFAIPIDHARKVVGELIKFGKPRSAWIGLSVMNISWLLAENLSIRDRRGVIINGVAKHSPAEQAGLRMMDIIREINGKRIENRADAEDAFYGVLVEDEVRLLLERAGRPMTVTLRLGEGQ